MNSKKTNLIQEKSYQFALNRHGRIQNILATHGYENTDWFFNMVLCVFMVKIISFYHLNPASVEFAEDLSAVLAQVDLR